MIKQIIISLFTISCRLKKIETHNILLNIECSSLHAPIFMPLTLLVPPFCWHAPVSMLQYARFRPHASIFRQIYYSLSDNKTNKLFPDNNFMHIEKNQMSFFFTANEKHR